MSLIQSKYAKGIIALAYPSIAGAATAIRFEHQLAAAPAAGDILDLAMIPAGTRVIDMILDADDLDTNGAPTLTMDVGVMSGDFGSEDGARTCGAEFFSASTLGQAGGVARPTLKTAFRTTKAGKDRSIGIKFPVAAATFAAGVIGLTVIVSTE
ncbi:virion structural protein [Sinorhizobium phage PBC5]|uniref:virion structural protein n=1 Tax=Sinorhizobium phage PBC5 TaxID=179237 RepID=UPI001BE60B3E|nr:virion structural protein [Sinorhizobium phage PBC5]